MEYTFNNVPDILENVSLSGYSCVVEDKPLPILQELFDEMKKEYRERRTEGLRSAMEQRKEAEKLVRDEMKALGYTDGLPFGSGIRWYNF